MPERIDTPLFLIQRGYAVHECPKERGWRMHEWLSSQPDARHCKEHSDEVICSCIDGETASSQSALLAATGCILVKALAVSFNLLTGVFVYVIISLTDIPNNDIPDGDITRDNLMTDRTDLNRYLPLTEATYYILLALAEPLHGYGVMQRVEEMSQGTVRLGPGTLYGAFQTLEKEGLIKMVREEERRKSYQITARGRQVLAEQVRRLQVMTRNGERVVGELNGISLGER